MRDTIINGSNTNLLRVNGFIVYSFYTTLESSVNHNCLIIGGILKYILLIILYLKHIFTYIVD